MEINNKLIEIYGFSGKAGSGKDYIAKHIYEPRFKNKKIHYIAFADILKQICSVQHCLSYSDLYDRKTSTTRYYLQTTADKIKEMYGNTYFIKALEFEIYKQVHRNNVDVFFVTDVRLDMEADMIKKMKGKLIRIHAPNRAKYNMLIECSYNQDDYNKKTQHISETQLDNYTGFDEIFDNDNDI